MLTKTKSLCVFVHFSELSYIPYYVEIFVNELARFFDDVVLLYNERSISSFPTLSNNVLISFQENRGYDFGMFYNYYKTINKDDYYRIACVNDSNILINNLDNVLKWENIVHFDFWGLIDSYEKPWFSISSDDHHIQSHFLVFHKNAIDLLDDYFKSVKVDAFFNEKNAKALRRKVIDKWEIGLSQFMKSKGIKIGHFFDSKEVTKQFNIRMDSNISHTLYQELLTFGYPLIKKKVMLDQKWSFGKSEPTWKKLIRAYGNPHWKPDTLIKELEQMKKVHIEMKRPQFVNKIILHLQQKSIKS
ncbi:MAG: hypothetical protein NTV01_16175 [Bacteroidia bacterium]|nr:hypothetical protein [Bacteroidia bacterium]